MVIMTTQIFGRFECNRVKGVMWKIIPKLSLLPLLIWSTETEFINISPVTNRMEDTTFISDVSFHGIKFCQFSGLVSFCKNCETDFCRILVFALHVHAVCSV